MSDVPQWKLDHQQWLLRNSKLPKRAIVADLAKQAPNNSYGVKAYYADIGFRCADCGRKQVWTARQQQWYFESARGSIYAQPRRCRICRRREREARTARQQGRPEPTYEFEIRRLGTVDEAEFAPMVKDADLDRHAFVRRLVTEYRSGENRFDKPGEVLLGANHEGRLVGVGGLNVDPHARGDRVGRLRHVYVMRSEREYGVGSALISALLSAASGRFDLVRLRTRNPAAAAFYERRGFLPLADDPTASHVWEVVR